MDALYPNLHDKFKSEGVCPICLMEMELSPRYSCCNAHTVCHRCRPYYYNCPTCQSPLDIEMPAVQLTPQFVPPPIHFMPHPLPPQFRTPYPSNPSAPPPDDFLQHERHAWRPPTPAEDQELISCSYSHLGCWVRVPIYLQELHESRCQFRPHLEEEQLPTDLDHGYDDLVTCSYQSAGCTVRMPPWRKSIHDQFCIYKDRYEAMNNISESIASIHIEENVYGDPNEMVECRFRRYGCMVKMPRRRKHLHEEKCNYKKYHIDQCYDEPDNPPPEIELDPEEQVECRWAENGCRVKPKRYRKHAHEEKCNYRMEECTYKGYGCTAIFQPSRKFAHEKSCEYAN